MCKVGGNLPHARHEARGQIIPLLRLLFGIISNALLLTLKATGVGHRSISGLRTSASALLCRRPSPRGWLAAAGLQRLLEVVSKFCEWSGMRIKLDKSVITAFDYLARRELDTKEILYNGKPLVCLAADESFPYLGLRASPTSGREPEALRAFARLGVGERPHLLRCQRRSQVPAAPNGADHAKGRICRFRNSAPLVNWSNAQLNDLYKIWL